jgi:hypothetical protein
MSLQPMTCNLHGIQEAYAGILRKQFKVRLLTFKMHHFFFKFLSPLIVDVELLK